MFRAGMEFHRPQAEGVLDQVQWKWTIPSTKWASPPGPRAQSFFSVTLGHGPSQPFRGCEVGKHKFVFNKDGSVSVRPPPPPVLHPLRYTEPITGLCNMSGPPNLPQHPTKTRHPTFHLLGPFLRQSEQCAYNHNHFHSYVI